ncbi:MAG: rhodanese-like domain-containing protein [Opitutales bacterium]
MNSAAEHFRQKLEHETDSWDLHDALRRGENVVVIDARSRQSFERLHIPGAVNLPHREMTSEATSTWDKDAAYVVYCDGIGCNASTKGALKLSELGFQVKELIGGLDWWTRDGYPLASA